MLFGSSKIIKVAKRDGLFAWNVDLTGAEKKQEIKIENGIQCVRFVDGVKTDSLYSSAAKTVVNTKEGEIRLVAVDIADKHTVRCGCSDVTFTDYEINMEGSVGMNAVMTVKVINAMRFVDNFPRETEVGSEDLHARRSAQSVPRTRRPRRGARHRGFLDKQYLFQPRVRKGEKGLLREEGSGQTEEKGSARRAGRAGKRARRARTPVQNEKRKETRDRQRRRLLLGLRTQEQNGRSFLREVRQQNKVTRWELCLIRLRITRKSTRRADRK